MTSVGVIYVRGYGGKRLLVGFSDGSGRVLDLSDWLDSEQYSSLKDEDLFEQFHVDEARSALVWPNGVSIDPKWIYDNSDEIGVAYESGGARITCQNCSNEYFGYSEVQMNTPGLTFLGLDFLNKTASVLICTHCSEIKLHARVPTRLRT